MLGKLTGVVLGFGLGMLLGNAGLALICATVGLFIGHVLVDRDEIPPPKSEMPPTREEIMGQVERAKPAAPVLPRPNDELARALCPIFVEVARADGEVSQDEVRVVREFFERQLGYDAAQLEVVRVSLKEAIKGPPGDLELLVKLARGLVKPDDRPTTVNALYDLALVDGELKRAEHDALKKAVAAFNLSEEQLQKITHAQLGSGDRHYQTLGLTPSATDEELKAAFRRLATENHPDRAAALGPIKAELAAEKFRKIKDAWEELKKLRGL